MSVPVGMVLNSIFLYLWKVLPGILSKRFPLLDHRMKLFLVILSAMTVGSWFLLAVGVVTGLRAVSNSYENAQIFDADSPAPQSPEIVKHPALYFGLGGLFIQLLIGISNSWTLAAAPKGKKKVTFLQILARGILAAIAICKCRHDFLVVELIPF